METLDGTIATERDMLTMLAARYTTTRPGTIADRWVRAEHVRNTQQTGRIFTRVADFIAIDKYATTQAMHGHEVKVSRADWLTELRDPTKSEAIRKFCDYWWLVVPDHKIVKPGELPEGWGLISISGGTLRARVKAPRLAPEPLTLDFIAGLGSAVERTANRAPLSVDARTVTMYPKVGAGHPNYRGVATCQARGGISPCAYHQPRKAGAGPTAF